MAGVIRTARRTLLSLAAVGAATAGWLARSPQSDARLEIVFLDVGQGDATLIRSPEGHVALVDAGNDADILTLLEGLGVTSIDLLVATHPDIDHVGGVDDVLWAIPVRYFMDNGQPHNTAAYWALQSMAEATQVPRLQPSGEPYRLGSVMLRFLPPPGWRRDTNNESIGIIVEFEAFRAMLPADAEADELNYFLELGVPDVTVLKASHHGARNGVTPRWLDVTRPEIVVISCGAGNAYGHPDPWALRYYEAVADDIYRTDLHGHVGIAASRDGAFEVVTGVILVGR